MPEFKIEINAIQETDTQGEYSIEPLGRGFGHTLGNSLRRVLLGQLSGTAITKLKINDLPHEFSPISGVVEDAVELILNLKNVHFKMETKKTTIVTLEAKGEQEVTAADLKTPAGIEVTNPDHHLATLSDKDSELNLTITVEYGKGYHLPEEESKTIGELLLDASFSPVQKVNYQAESTRVGRVTDLDKLIVELTTDGSIGPREAVNQAAAILAEHFEVLSDGAQVIDVSADKEKDTEEKEEEKTTAKVAGGGVIYLEELQVPTRVLNTLKEADVTTVSDVRELGEEGLLEIKNVGPKTVKLLMKKVEEEG